MSYWIYALWATWLTSALADPLDVDAAREAIVAQQGCYHVTFNYEEVEAHQEGYALAPPKTSDVLEYIAVQEATDTRVVLQHVLVTPPRIKHWKQVWEYEGTRYDAYSGLDQWSARELAEESARGAWVQVVAGVADNPRYGCSSFWASDGEPIWSCETWAPKPRRDKDRDDYTVLARTNTHRIHEHGWVHEQRNTKLSFDGDRAQPIVTEIGNNTYDRIDDAVCAEAALWWEKRSATWDQVQRAWVDVTARHHRYKVQARRGLFPLWLKLFWVARRAVPERKHDVIYARAVRQIERHVTPVPEG